MFIVTVFRRQNRILPLALLIGMAVGGLANGQTNPVDTAYLNSVNVAAAIEFFDNFEKFRLRRLAGKVFVFGNYA